MEVAVMEANATDNVDEETLFMTESNLLPIPIHRGIYFYCDREGYAAVHGFCTINIRDHKAAFGCWFGPYHCL